MRELVQQFFAGWTAHDANAVLAQFGQSFQLEDRIAGSSALIADPSVLRDYLRSRFALGDAFSGVTADIPASPSATNANATAAFRRSFGDRVLSGNAKLVCGSGYLTEVLIGSQ
ncbi:MAG: hypothetical protein M3T56_04860 [Chloroflexota bacterium]|nr:hypothetical protein [Chloroflexota bacterium]